MKKILLTLITFFILITANSQVLFYEDFDGISGFTAGGPGTYAFPSGWSLFNVDNKTPAGQVAYVNDAWERREDFNFNVGDSAVFSTSWYTPEGAADDWMWTPLIGSITSSTMLSWNAVTYDASYPDGYEVRIMTAPSVPTGGPGNLGNMVTNSTVVFSVAAENTTWTSRSVSLAAFAGQSVYVGFRNNSYDKFLLLIDDVKVETILNHDAALTAIQSISEYSKIPLNQNPVFPLSATINNLGAQAVSNVTLNVNVYDGSNTLVFTSSSLPMNSLASGANAVFTTTVPFTPSAVDQYAVQYSVSITENDQVPSNNMKSDTIVITDSVYARDMGIQVGTLGIGAGNGGNLGNQFVITDTVQLSSVSVHVNSTYSSWKMAVDIFSFANGSPSSLLYSGPVDTITGPLNGWLQFPVLNNLILYPDTYLVAAREIDSTLSIGQTVNKFTNGTIWVNWPTSPLGGWANVEDFGSNFAKTFMIRANLIDYCTGIEPSVAAISSAGDTICVGSSTALSGSGALTYEWTGGIQNGVSFTPSSTNTYTVTGTDAIGCSNSASITLVLDSAVVSAFSSAGDTLCVGTSTTLAGSGASTYVWTGGVLDGVSFIPTATEMYTVVGTNGNGCVDSASITLVLDSALVTAFSSAGDTICAGNSTTLSGSGALSYTWSGGVVDGVSFSPANTQTYTVTGVAANGCSNSASITIVVNPCLGLESENNTAIVFAYPNPTQGQFVLDLKEAMQILVYNALGEVIVNEKYNAGLHQVDISGSANGVYVVKAFNKESQFTFKLIKD